jgi:hypothetical protein
MPAPTGTATLSVAVPPLPDLVGFEIFVQGLAFGAGKVDGFTNAVEERILP